MPGLLATRRFGPLFVTQFLGAFNDNLFRTTLIFLVTYRLYAGDIAASATLATLATGLFVLPFVLFGGLAGEICDKRDKAAVARWVKLAEIGMMALGLAGLMLGSVTLSLAVVFLLGVHSTVFGPLKYAILPQLLHPGELLKGTGLVEGGTFVAILLGQIAGGLLPPLWAGAAALAVALTGWAVSRAIPAAPPETPGQPLDWNGWRTTARALGGAFTHARIRGATLVISWFWALGAIYTTQFVPLIRNVLGGTEAVATLCLAAFSIGIALGSAAIGRALGGRVSTAAAPWALLAMALAAIDFFFAARALAAVGPAGGMADFLAQPQGWRILADLTGLAAAGGVLSVPLYGILQTATPAGTRARTIAASNIVNSAFQTLGVVAIGAAINAGAGVPLALLGAGLSALLLIPVVMLRLR